MCEIADIRNCGPVGQPEAITAALYLSEFVGDIPWAHLDVCGTVWALRTDAVRYASGRGPDQGARPSWGNVGSTRRARSTMSSTWWAAVAAPGGRGRFSWISMSQSAESTSGALKSSTRT